MPVEGGLRARGLALGCTGTDIPALTLILVGDDVIVLHGVQDLGPVEGGQVAEVLVLLDAHGAARDVGEAAQAHVSQLEHLEENQGVVEEEVVATDDGEVGEKLAEARQAIDAKEEQIVGNDRQPRETQAAEVLRPGLEHQQDLQVALNHRAVLQRPQVGHVVPNIFAGADWREEETGLVLNTYRLGPKVSSSSDPSSLCYFKLRRGWKRQHKDNG